MPSRIRTWLILALVAAAALWLWESDRKLRHLGQDLQAARQSQTNTEQKIQRLKRGQAGPPAAARSLPRTEAHSAPVPRPLDPRVGALLHDSKLQAAYLAAKRARLDRQYGPLFRALHFGPAQVDQLKALLMQREEQQLDLTLSVPGALRSSNAAYQAQWYTDSMQLSVGGPGRDPDVQAATQLMQQANQAFQAGATNLLGSDGYQKLADYERTLPMRAVAENFASAVAASPDQITSSQLDQLAQVLTQANAFYSQGKSANVDGENWSEAFRQAQGVLSPGQLSAFQETVAISRSGKLMTDLVRAAVGSPRIPEWSGH